MITASGDYRVYVSGYESVVRRLQQWRPRFEAGDLHPRGLFGPRLSPTERAFVVGNGRNDIRREWRWSDQAQVTTLTLQIGIAIKDDLSSSLGDVVGSEWNPWVLAARPARVPLMTDWLKVAAAFAASVGRLDEWFETLQSRRPEPTMNGA